MKTLPKSLFAGSENFSENDKKRLFVNNFSDNVETVLGEFAWDGKATGIIGLTLSNDNRRVESGRFYTRGVLQERSIKVAASEIWENAHESVTLTIKLPRAEVFRFTDGGLYSQYVDEEAVTYYMHSTVEDRPPVPIPAQEKEEWQVGKFCLRQVCYVSKSSTARSGVTLTYVVLIFPTSKEQLLSGSELTSNPSWPGLRLCSGEMQLLPRPSTPWKCPILPLLRTSADERTTPSSTALRHAISAIMRKSSSRTSWRTSPACWRSGSTSQQTPPTSRRRQPQSPGPACQHQNQRLVSNQTITYPISISIHLFFLRISSIIIREFRWTTA